MSYYKLPSINLSTSLALIVDTLLGKNITWGRTKMYSYVGIPYGVVTSFDPIPRIEYIDHYPLEILMPVKAKLVGDTQTNTTITLYLRIYRVEYTNVDPYSIDTGFYKVRRDSDICIQCIVLFSLIAGMIVVAVVVLWKLRRD